MAGSNERAIQEACVVTCENAAMKKLVAQFNSYLRNFRLERISSIVMC